MSFSKISNTLHGIKSLYDHMFVIIKENVMTEIFPTCRQMSQQFIWRTLNTSLTSWGAAEGVTGGEGNRLLGSRVGAGAEWVGEIWDTQGEEEGEKRRRDNSQCAGLNGYILGYSNQHCSELHRCIVIRCVGWLSR